MKGKTEKCTSEGRIDRTSGDMHVAVGRFENDAFDYVCAGGKEKHGQLREIVLDQLPPDGACESTK